MMDKAMYKVLVVDDEENIRMLVQEILHEAGYDVVTASDGREALSKVEALNIDVMMLDMNMPGMSGIEVLQEATNHWPDICVIMVTAVNDINTAVEAMKQGAYDYITKPFDKHGLIQKVQKAIDLRNQIMKTETDVDNIAEKWPTGLNPDDWVEIHDEVE
jgi:DNA-binding NtrC family response regulator